MFWGRKKKQKVDDYNTLILPAVRPHKHLFRLHKASAKVYTFLCFNNGCSRRAVITKRTFHGKAV